MRAELAKEIRTWREKYSFFPPNTQDMLSYLRDFLADNTAQIFLISSPNHECQANFAAAIAQLSSQDQKRVTLYKSISAGFCNSFVTLAAKKLLQQGFSNEDICHRLNLLEKRSFFIYTSLDVSNTPSNDLTKVFDTPPRVNPRGYPIAKITEYSEEDGFRAQKINEVSDLNSLVEQFRKEIVHFTKGNPVDAFIVCPTNHRHSQWFCEHLSQSLECKNTLRSAPIMPEHLILMGSECFAVRVYHPEDHDLIHDFLDDTE